MLDDLFEFEQRVPEWLRPAYRGAVFILGMGSGWSGKLFVAAILATLILLAGLKTGLSLFAGLLGTTMAGGAVAGALRGLLKPVERWGAPGVWLEWTIALAGFAITAIALAPTGPFTLEDPTLYPVIAGFAAAGAGMMVLLDDRRLNRLTPRQFAMYQARQRLWEAAARSKKRRAAWRRLEGGIPPFGCRSSTVSVRQGSL